jgi:phage repressor protein C with HTH and peptisase S24 domain
LKRACGRPAKNEGKRKPRFSLAAVEKGQDGLFRQLSRREICMNPKRQTFGERLQDVIDKHAGGVVRRFAQAIGVNHQAVHNWITEQSLPGSKALVSLWNVYRVDPLWLLTGTQSIQGAVVLRVSSPAEEADLESEMERDQYVPVPLLADTAAAKSPHEAAAEDIEDFVVVRAAWATRPERLTCARVKGNQLAPMLPAGSLVAIDHGYREADKLHGKLVAFRHGAGVAVRWCHSRAGDAVLGLTGEPPTRQRGDALLFTGEAAASCVVGRIVWWWAEPPK